MSFKVNDGERRGKNEKSILILLINITLEKVLLLMYIMGKKIYIFDYLEHIQGVPKAFMCLALTLIFCTLARITILKPKNDKTIFSVKFGIRMTLKLMKSTQSKHIFCMKFRFCFLCKLYIFFFNISLAWDSLET